jgi:hypothetical protein
MHSVNNRRADFKGIPSGLGGCGAGLQEVGQRQLATGGRAATRDETVVAAQED